MSQPAAPAQPETPPQRPEVRRAGPLPAMARGPVARGLLAGLAYGACVLLAAEPLNIWPVCFVMVWPLSALALWAGGTTARDRGGAGWAGRWRIGLAATGAGIGAMPAWGFLHAYLWDTTAAGVIPLVIYFGCLPALFVWLLARWARLHVAVRTLQERPEPARWLAWTGVGRAARATAWLPAGVVLAVLWMGIEWARGEHLLGGYSWYGVATPLVSTFWAMLASLGGAASVAVVPLLAACGAAGVWSARERGRSPRRGVLAVVGIGVALCAQAWLLHRAGAASAGDRSDDRPAYAVAVVQTNLPQSNKQRWPIEDRLASLRRWADLSARAAESRPNLIVWPETMFPAPFPGNGLNPDALEALERSPASAAFASWGRQLERLQASLGVPMLVGAIANEGLEVDVGPDGRLRDARTQREFNSVHLIHEGRVDPRRYDKVRLMPFGETIPGLWRWPALQNWFVGLGARGMSFSLSRGSSATAWSIGGRSVAAPICFEAAYGSSCRWLAYGPDGRRRVDLLVNVSNDGWFYGVPWGRGSFVTACRWRSIELGVPMIRAANTGLSVMIDSWGRLIPATASPAEAERGAEGVLVWKFRWAEVSAGDTLYGRTGDVVGPTSMYAALGIALLLALPGQRRRVDPGPAPSAGQ